MSSISSYGLDLARWGGSSLGGRGAGAVAVYDAYLDSLNNRHYRRGSYDPHADNDNSYRRASNLCGYSSASLSTRIPGGNKYDRFGRQLSNYDKWRLQYHQPGYLDEDTVDESAFRRSTLVGRSSNLSSLRPNRDENQDNSSRLLRSNRNHYNNNYNSSNIYSSLGQNSYNDNNLSSSTRSSISNRTTWRSSTSTPSATNDTNLRTSSTKTSSSIAPSNNSVSSSRSASTLLGLPTSVRSKLGSFEVRDVRGDGNCYYRCLSVFFTGSESQYMRYRREVLDFVRESMDSSMVRAEIGARGSAKDYFNRKTRADTQDWAETTEIIATAALYRLNVHVLALVPGRRAVWEWLHFDPSIAGTGSCGAKADIYLYNHGSVHFMLCTPK